MFVRTVRFTDVDSERVRAMLERIKASDGPPPGVASTGIKVLLDESQGTAVVLQYFASREDMEEGAKTFEAMDPSDTPGTRASVDMCEIALELEA